MSKAKRRVDGRLRRLPVSLKRGEAMEVSKISIGSEKLVYVILADAKIQYVSGRSRVVYIGTTKNGIDRVANSVALRAPEIFSVRGVRKFHVRIVTCRPRQRVKTWRKLERALLLTFRETYGEVPRCNTQGKGIIETDEFDYFARARVRRVLEELA